MKNLTITASPTPAGPALVVAGDLDHTNARQLRRAGRGAAPSAGQVLTVDLGNVGFRDSSGLTALIALHNDALAAGADMALVAVSASVRRLLRLTGLDQVFDLRDRA
ncbi:hypothetical protein GCM10010297_15680 [Streptomyces malachitofuscus]|nr:hypothetical protein GCM10010297_15680 [Streptomyces malachitofuscus]